MVCPLFLYTPIKCGLNTIGEIDEKLNVVKFLYLSMPDYNMTLQWYDIFKAVHAHIITTHQLNAYYDWFLHLNLFGSSEKLLHFSGQVG